MSKKSTINIGRNFSRFPLGRYRRDGSGSGEEFREAILEPILQSGVEKLIVELDDALGYGSSFLEEAFGGLVRSGYPSVQILGIIELVTEDLSLIDEIKGYIVEAGENG